MNFNNKSVIFLSIILTLVVVSSFFVKEGYSNNNLELIPGTYPETTVLPLLTDSFPYTGSKTVSNNNVADIWWHYPIFRVGSYTQITNNLKYPNNPDGGQCRGPEFAWVILQQTKTYF